MAHPKGQPPATSQLHPNVTIQEFRAHVAGSCTSSVVNGSVAVAFLFETPNYLDLVKLINGD